MPDAQIPVTIGHWLVALLPLAAILILLVGLRWSASTAAPVGYFIAVAAALLLFQTPIRNVALQTVKGVWDAVFILYVIVPALLLYQISKEAGAFETLRRGIEAYTPNNLLHVLAFGWVFASFLQGITGFGAPVAVTAPLLVAVGVRPLWAVIIPLIGHAWANTFGTLAVAWEGLELVTDVPEPIQTAIWAAIMLWIGNLLAGVMIAWLYGKGKGLKEALPAILLISLIHGGGQLALVSFTPTLANFLPGAVAVAAIIGLGRTGWYSGPSEVEESQVMEEGEQEEQGKEDQEEAQDAREEGEHMPLWMAFSPYVVLMALIGIALLIPPINDALSSVQIGLPFPELETGYGFLTEAEEPYSAFSPFTHAGTFLLISAIFAFILFSTHDYIEAEKPGEQYRIDDIIINTIKTSIPSAIALLALVPLAMVMQGSGQTLELALGIGAVASGPLYAGLAPLIGTLGAFMTGSNLSSNILFAPLQQNTAQALEISAAIALAAQTAGAALGNSFAPSNVLLGLGAVGREEGTGNVIRRTIIFALIAVGLIAVVAVVGVLFFTEGG